MKLSPRDSQQARQRVAAQVRRLRAAKCLSQETAAGAAGLAVRHFRKVESAEVNVTLDTLVKIATALGVDVVELLRWPVGEGEG